MAASQDEEVPTMEYRPFGQTGLEVPTIGFGCWEIAGGYGEVHLARVVEGSAGMMSIPQRRLAADMKGNVSLV